MRAENSSRQSTSHKRKTENEDVCIVVDSRTCRLTRTCIKACPHGAISVNDRSASIDLRKCGRDGICIAACPHGAIRVVGW